MFDIAFSFIFSIVRSVRKSCIRVVSLSLSFPPSLRETQGDGKERTYHEASSDIRRCCAIHLVLVRLADLQRVDDGREPVDELVEVHARCGLARGGRPVVLGESEEVVELGVDERGDPLRRARLGLLEGRRGREVDRAAALGRARWYKKGWSWSSADGGKCMRVVRTEGRLENARARHWQLQSARDW